MFSSTVSVLGYGITILSITMLFPALVSFGYGEINETISFMFSFIVTFFVGIALIISNKGNDIILNLRSIVLITILVWPTMALFACIPFILSESSLTFTDAFFESISGITTNGASVISDISNATKGIIIWRSLLQWFGGFGTILLGISFFSLIGVGGLNLFHSSMPKSERDTVSHRFWQSLKTLWWIYILLTIICAISLDFAGMGLFDAISHSFSTISTGGFTTRTGGIEEFNSQYINSVLIIFMILASINSTLYWAIINLKFRELFREGETIYFLSIIIIFMVIIIIINILSSNFMTFNEVNNNLFNIVSSISTTGFSVGSSDLNFYNFSFLAFTFCCLMLIGGSSISTTGGIKQLRFIVFFKLTYRELFKLSHPHGVTSINYMGKAIDEISLRSTWGFLMMFISLIIILSMLFSICGFNFYDSFILTVLNVSNTGAGLPLLSQTLNYSNMTDFIKWVIILTQIITKVEIILFIIFLSATFWRN